MDIEEAISHAKRGNSVLFTGAGFSFGAENTLPSPDNKIPDAREFSNRLAKAVDVKSGYDLPIISQYYISKEGEHGLVNLLINTFSVKSVQPYHEKITSIPWRRVYTTNYDNIFEFAALKSGTEWIPLTMVDGATASRNRCIHINGHINNLTIQTLKNQIKLTHSSYSTEAFSGSQWPQQFRQDLNSAKSIIYIGYSLYDLDIRRILFKSPELKRKTIFIVGPDDDDVVVSPLKDYGDVHRIGAEGFSRLCESNVSSPDISKFEYTWLVPYKIPYPPVKPTDKDSIELLTMGVTSDAHVAWAINEPDNSHCVLRNSTDDTIREIDRGKRWFLVHSDLGNGKTIYKQQMSLLLANRDYKIFWDSNFELNRNSDLAELAKEDGKIAVFLDESPDRFDIIDGLLGINHPNILVFICIRTTLFELGEARYSEYLPNDYIPMDINRLNDDDIVRFVKIFNLLGLWGSRADDSDWAKQNFITVECGRGIAKLIVSIFENSEIGRRITKSATSIVNNKSDVASLIILSFLLNRIGHPPNPTILSDIMNKDAWEIVKSDKFKNAGEFIRFKDGLISSRSSIISTYLLRKTLAPENLVWHIEFFVRELAGIRRDPTLHHIFTELQRFPVIENLIESGRKREIIIGYFQSVKDLPYNEKRALFWLHYAMARLAYGEFSESALYFEHARSLAKGHTKDTAEVNNHYARLLLESRTKSPDYTDYFDAFEMAHNILIEQMNKGANKHFPYRQARTYVQFISFRKNDFNDSQIKRFVVSCKQVISAIEHLQGSISNSNEVSECKLSMERAIKIATGPSESTS